VSPLMNVISRIVSLFRNSLFAITFEDIVISLLR
jgi:hypothetical protein